MAKSEEEYAALVDTLDIPLEATLDIETLRDWLSTEIGKEFSDDGIQKLWSGVEARYEILPQLGMSISTMPVYEGTLKEYSLTRYRDLITGRFVPAFDVRSMIEYWRAEGS